MYDIMYQLIVAIALAAPWTAPSTDNATAGQPAAAPAPERPSGEAELGDSVPASLLDEARGGTDTVLSDAHLAGEASGNNASQVITGANSIATGSLAGAVGLPVVIQNTGANVLIQQSTIVNVQFK